MGKNKKSAETRTKIFIACSEILKREGLSNLTLQAVAYEAGISKGGLLYHFETKQDLIEALFEYHNGIFEARLAELVTAEGDRPGAFLRAYAKASTEQMADPENASLYVSLFAAEEKYTSAHKLMREKYVKWQEQIEHSGIDSDWAMLLRFATDGLWFIEMHQYAPPTPDQRDKIVRMIVEMTSWSENPVNKS
jgi:AcrR family transcriptional regulator